ncbi:MAG: T9SS type A sorting domain-containing protein [Spirosomataceae bacterium]
MNNKYIYLIIALWGGILKGYSQNDLSVQKDYHLDKLSPCDNPTGMTDQTICIGESATLIANCSPGGTVTWYDNIGAFLANGSPFITNKLDENKVFQVSCESPSPDCASPKLPVNVTVVSSPASPTGTSNANINAGQSASLDATCSTGIPKWYDNSETYLSQTTPFITPVLSSSTTYKVRCEVGSCTSTFVSVVVNVTECSITTSASPSYIDIGQSSTLSYTGCSNGTVTWNNGAGSGNNVVVSPSSTTTYTATCTPTGGGDICTSNVAVNIRTCPVTAIANPTTINAGQSSTLSYTGCIGGSVTWDNGAGSGNNVSVSPTSSTTYTATCAQPSDGSPCTSSVTVSVNTCSITASANPTSINAGQSSTLSYSGCTSGTVTWNNGAGSGNNVVVSPASTTTYTATCTPTGGGTACTSSVTVNVNACSVTASANPTSINAGQSSTLSYSGCTSGTVTWNNGAGSGNNVVVSPASTTTYTATCTPTGGGTACTSSVTVSVNACSITASANPSSINAGQSSTLSYSGCTSGTVTWNNGAGSGNNVVVSPASSTTYTATCTPTGGGTTCTSSVTVSVNACSITASANPSSINAGQSSTLSYSGCTSGTVTWNNGAGSGNNVVVSPTSTTTYTATCTPTGGGTACTSSVTISVNACSITASANPSSINAGQSSTLSYSGCTSGTVTWNNGAGSGNNVVVSPASTTTYTATCTPTGGGTTCTSSVTVSVNTCSVTASANPTSINAGQSSTLSYAGCTSGTVTWNNGAGSGNNVVVSPASTTTYTATCTPTSGGTTCTSSVTVSVNACSITASANPSSINAGQSSTLSYSGCTSGTVTWNNGAGSGNNVVVSPASSTTYTATCTPTGGGTTCTSSVTVSVNTCSITASANPLNILVGSSSTLSASNCTGVVSWDNGLGVGITKVVSPVKSTTYVATCTISPTLSCSSSTSVSVNPRPISIVRTVIKQPNCSKEKSGNIEFFFDRGLVAGESYIKLTLVKDNKGEGVYLFSDNSVKTQSNLEAGSYYALIQTFTANDVVSAQASTQVVINDPLPVLFSLKKNDVKCFGGKDGNIEISASGGNGSYRFQLNPPTPSIAFNNLNKHIIDDLAAGTYYVNVSDELNCYSQTQTIIVGGPTEAVKLTKISQKDPRGFETKDGVAVVKIEGGTPNYIAGWLDSKEVSYGLGVMNGNQNQNNTLRGGEYTVRVFDSNYNTAKQKAGCYAEAKFTLVEPPIIEAKINVSKEISCFGKKDGSIEVIPSGGVPNKIGDGYKVSLVQKNNIDLKFTAKKYSFENLLSTNYTITVTDSNGVSRSFDYFLNQPTKVQYTINAIKDVLCFGDKTGEISLTPSGGVGPYTVNWNTGLTGTQLVNLTAQKYTSLISDSRGCLSDVITAEVKSPPKITITLTANNPSCFDKCDGDIVAAVSGGVIPYSFGWDNRPETTPFLRNLCGNENLTFNIKDKNNCSAKVARSIIKPAKLDIRLSPEKNVCQGQSVLLDATTENASAYSWKAPNGQTFSSPSIEAKQIGTYSVTLFDKNKCGFNANVLVRSIPYGGRIRFASSTDVPINEPVVILNLSNPLPTSVDWQLPKEATLDFRSNERLQFKLNKLGEYYVGIRAVFPQCELFQNQRFNVVNFIPKIVSIKNENDNINLKVSPNPNIGEFEVDINFDNPTDFKVRLVDLAQPNLNLFEQSEQSKTTHKIQIGASHLSSGTYMLIVESAKGVARTRVIISR